jgi:hypothetical protein
MAAKKIQDILKTQESVLGKLKERFAPEVRKPSEIDVAIKQKERTLERLKHRISEVQKEKKEQMDQYDTLLKSLQDEVKKLEKVQKADRNAFKKIHATAKK